MVGVYISYPFCRQKCSYCNFASGTGAKGLETDYLAAVLDEVRAWGWEWEPETLYLGGGSPDRIEAKDLQRLIGLIPGSPWKEATLEAAPGDITLERAVRWAECGFNRISLGVQSFVESEIRQTGRRHSAEIVARDVAVLREAGISKINIDLIAGLAGQSRESWNASLNWLERLAVDHASVYMLEVDEGSRLGRELLDGGSRYGARDVPDDSLIAEFYETAVERLAAMGLRRYEISNFARPGSESLHNLKYWRFEPYVGFGADAHSCDQTVRTENVATAVEYVHRWQAGRQFRAAELPVRRDEERFFVGLRLTDGILLGADEWMRFARPIERLLEGGLLKRDGNRLSLTERGVMLSNEVFQEFI